jgi:simple sugar transport system ATP-binding protein
MMVGRPMFGVARGDEPADDAHRAQGVEARLVVRDLSALGAHGLAAVRNVSFEVRRGEILGVAGVSGNGQTELAEVLSGMRRPTAGSIEVDGVELVGAGPQEVMTAGVGRIPEDRHASLITDLSVAYNLVIERLDDFRRGVRLDEGQIRRNAEALIERFAIKAGPDQRVGTLSGGNIRRCSWRGSCRATSM